MLPTCGVFRRMTLVLVGLCALACLAPVGGQSQPDLAGKKEKQKAVKADTEQFALQVATVVHALKYRELDDQIDSKMLEEIAGTLGDLSKEQMIAVIAHLDKALKADTKDLSEKEVLAAQKKHKEIMAAFQQLLAKYDAVK